MTTEGAPVCGTCGHSLAVHRAWDSKMPTRYWSAGRAVGESLRARREILREVVDGLEDDQTMPSWSLGLCAARDRVLELLHDTPEVDPLGTGPTPATDTVVAPRSPPALLVRTFLDTDEAPVTCIKCGHTGNVKLSVSQALADVVDKHEKSGFDRGWKDATDFLLEQGRFAKDTPFATPVSPPRERTEVVRRLRQDQPWPLADIVATLAGAVEHLLGQHSCDVHGHEEIRGAQEAGIEWLTSEGAEMRTIGAETVIAAESPLPPADVELRSMTAMWNGLRWALDRCRQVFGAAAVDAAINVTSVTSDEPAATQRWRTGRKVGRTLYLDGALAGVMDTPEMASAIVDAMNRTCSTCGKLENQNCSNAFHSQTERFDCAECGEGVSVDEERCCTQCGRDANVMPIDAPTPINDDPEKSLATPSAASAASPRPTPCPVCTPAVGGIHGAQVTQRCCTTCGGTGVAPPVSAVAPAKPWGPTLLSLAQDVRDSFRCVCVDSYGGEVDPKECECGGDGLNPSNGCWRCEAERALINASKGDDVSLVRDILMMGSIGTPLENFTDADPDDSYWYEREVIRRRVVFAEAWTVERIGRRVFTFALDDIWPSATPEETP